LPLFALSPTDRSAIENATFKVNVSVANGWDESRRR
jgi:hypothetical protein